MSFFLIIKDEADSLKKRKTIFQNKVNWAIYDRENMRRPKLNYI